VAGGLPDDKLRRVEGLASSRLLRPETPTDPINRRISIVVMTREAEQRMLHGTSPATPAVTPAPAPATVPAPAPIPQPVALMPALPEATATTALQIPAELTKTPTRPGV
jgi:chemotaxis protein MotB